MRNEKLCYRKAIRKGVGMKLWVRPLQEERKKTISHGSLPTPARHRPLPFLREGLQRTDALLLIFIFIKILLTDFPTVFLRQPCSFWV